MKSNTNTRGSASVLLLGTIAIIFASLLSVTARETVSASYTAPIELTNPYISDLGSSRAEADCVDCNICMQSEREQKHSDYSTTNGPRKGPAHICQSPAYAQPCGHTACGGAMAPIAETLDRALYAAVDGDFVLIETAARQYPQFVHFNTELGTMDVSHPCIKDALYGRVTLPTTATS